MSKKFVLKNVFSLGLVQIANYIFPLITVPIVSRIIGPDKLGVINFSSAIITYFVLIISYGFDLSATREIARDPTSKENRNRVFSEVFFSQCLLFLFSLFCFLVLFYFMPQLRNEASVAIFSYLLCISTVFTQNWLFQAMQNLQVVAILNVSTKIIFTVIILLIIREKKDYIWQPLAISIAQIIVSVVSFIWAVKKFELRLYRVRIRSILSMLYQQKTIFFSLVVISFYTNANIVILGLFQNNQQVGFYTAAQKLIGIIQSVITVPLSQAIYPFIGKAFGESYQNGLAVAQKLLAFIIFFTGFAALLLWFLGPVLIGLFYGEAFQSSAHVFRILVFIPMIIAVSNVFGLHVMLNLKMDEEFFRITAGAALLSILLNFIFVRKIGYIGTAYTSLLTELFVVIIMFLQLKRKGIYVLNIRYFNLLQIFESLKLLSQKFIDNKRRIMLKGLFFNIINTIRLKSNRNKKN